MHQQLHLHILGSMAQQGSCEFGTCVPTRAYACYGVPSKCLTSVSACGRVSKGCVFTRNFHATRQACPTPHEPQAFLCPGRTRTVGKVSCFAGLTLSFSVRFYCSPRRFSGGIWTPLLYMRSRFGSHRTRMEHVRGSSSYAGASVDQKNFRMAYGS